MHTDSTSDSVGINHWAAGQAIELDWAHGTGDARQIGWVRADGKRAIETNGDPVLEGVDGFAEMWAARGVEVAS